MKKIILLACIVIGLAGCSNTPKPEYTMDIDKLRSKSETVEKLSPAERSIIDDMKSWMDENEMNGLSAPQIGIKKRIMLIRDNEKIIVMINPLILESKDEQTRIESSPNVPGLHAIVKRSKTIKIEYQDVKGGRFRLTESGGVAGLIQQQFDYFEGNLFFDNARSVYFSEK